METQEAAAAPRASPSSLIRQVIGTFNYSLDPTTKRWWGHRKYMSGEEHPTA